MGTEMECAVRRHEKVIYFTRELEAINVSLTQQCLSPTGEKIHWRETARCRLQISHADTKHTEYSYIALYGGPESKK